MFTLFPSHGDFKIFPLSRENFQENFLISPQTEKTPNIFFPHKVQLKIENSAIISIKIKTYLIASSTSTQAAQKY